MEVHSENQERKPLGENLPDCLTPLTGEQPHIIHQVSKLKLNDPLDLLPSSQAVERVRSTQKADQEEIEFDRIREFKLYFTMNNANVVIERVNDLNSSTTRYCQLFYGCGDS